MNGIELKNTKISPIKVEKIKWISLLILSHLFSYLLTAGSIEVEPKENLPELREGSLRLQLQIYSQVPENSPTKDVLLMNMKKKVLSQQARLIKKIPPRNIDSLEDEYLVEIPEVDLLNIISSKGEKIMAYPKSKRTIELNNEKRRKDYEIHF